MRRQVVLRQWADDEGDLSMPTIQHTYELDEQQFARFVDFLRGVDPLGPATRFIESDVDSHMATNRDRLDTAQLLALTIATRNLRDGRQVPLNVAATCIHALEGLVTS